jgi:hypothetical protein
MTIRDKNGRFTPAMTGSLHPKWKGGTISWNGYRLICIDGIQRREHRVIWERANGPIPKGMILHHKNGNKLDNRLENLELTTRGIHPQIHFAKAAPACSVCGVPSQALNLCNRHYKQLTRYGRIPDPSELRSSGRRPTGYARNPL